MRVRKWAARFTPVDYIVIAFCAGAVAFLLCGATLHVKDVSIQVSDIRALDPNQPAISGYGFQQNAVFRSIQPPPLHGKVELYGSWLGSDKSTGVAFSRWYRPVPQFDIFIAGYPNHPDNQLLIEAVTKSGVLQFSVSAEPAQSWSIKGISLRGIKNLVKFRIIAIDGSTLPGGWLGFSQPFLIENVDNRETLKQALLVLLTTSSSLIFFIYPGLVLRGKVRESRGIHLPFILIPVPGILALALLGLASWVGPHQLSARFISRFGLWALLLYVAYCCFRTPASRLTDDWERRVLLVVVILAAIAVTKGSYSVGPKGELYTGTIARSLAVGERADSRFSYSTVQLVASRSRPNSPFAQAIFGGWNFSHRGPIPGLAASPIVLASPVSVPAQMPAQRWTIFDPEGFSAYRIAMIVMACASLAGVFGLGKVLLSDEWAFFAFLIAVGAPFSIHEIYYTWPKLEAALFVLLSAYLIFHSRYFRSGLSLGVGYLCHPSTLVWFPSLAALVALSRASRNQSITRLSERTRVCALKTLLIAAGLVPWLLLWKLINRRHYAQEFFLAYFAMASGLPLTLGNWLRSRIHSLLNTIVPLNLFVFHRHEPGLHSIYGPSSPVIAFFFQYWNTLPFGVGIAFFFCLLALLYIAFRKARAWLLWVFAVPFGVFVVYWGWASKGLMREGLHAWFLGLMIFSVVVWKKYVSYSHRFWRISSWALLFRGIETLLLLLLPSVWSQHMIVQAQFAFTDVLMLALMFTATGWLYLYTFRFAERLRRRSLIISEPS